MSIFIYERVRHLQHGASLYPMHEKSLTLLPVIEEIAKIGCYETDMATGTWTGSDNFIEIFGLEKKPFYTVGEFVALVHPEDVEWVLAYFTECLKKQIDFNCEYRCLKKNGETIFVNSRSKIYYLPDGTPEKILGVKQDITVSKQNEWHLRKLNESNKEKNEILSMVAHDLKTPIAQLEGLAALMKSALDEKFHGLVTLQEGICNSARQIISEIVEIAELEEETYSLKRTCTDINRLIVQVVSNFRVIAEEKRIAIRTILSDECTAQVNPERFTRVINNLLSNALKFTPENRVVELTTACRDNKIVVTVRDEGIGIKNEYLPILFDKFSKTVRRPGTNGERSTGLGLNIVKRICDLHHGTISVESVENIGTTFQMEFPREELTPL